MKRLLVHRYDSQDESSEEFIGEWAEDRGIRDQLVIATKLLKIEHCLHCVGSWIFALVHISL